MTIQHLDYDALNALKDIMEDDFGFLIETFIKDSRERLSTLNGLIGTENSDGIRRAAHSFKGSCSNLGALRLASLCASVERNALAFNFATVAEDVAVIQQEFLVVEKSLKDFLG